MVLGLLFLSEDSVGTSQNLNSIGTFSTTLPLWIFFLAMPALEQTGTVNEPEGSVPTENDCVDGIPLRCRHVIREMIDTEGAYADALRSVIEGYHEPMVRNEHLPITSQDVADLFNNISELYTFSRDLHRNMQASSSDMIALANCFLDNESCFKMYTAYCTGYPKSVEILSVVQRQPVIAEFLKGCQLALGQMLPLGAYLLKPVQRILKYHLLLADLKKQYGKRFAEDTPEWIQLQQAQKTMGGVANYINMMKRKHEASVRAQEIISSCVGWDTNIPSGGLIMEHTFRCRNSATRTVYMFEELLLLTKKNKEGIMVYKGHIPYSNLTVNENMKDPLSFEVNSTSNKSLHTLLWAKDYQQKAVWLIELRKLMLEHHPNLPESAKELMLKSLTVKDVGELFKDISQKSPTAERGGLIDLDQAGQDNTIDHPETRLRTQNVISSSTEDCIGRSRARERVNARRMSTVQDNGDVTCSSPALPESDDEEPAPVPSKKQEHVADKPDVFYPERHLEAARSNNSSKPSYSAPISIQSRRIQNASVCNHWINTSQMGSEQVLVPMTSATDQMPSRKQLRHTVGLVSKLVKRYSELQLIDVASVDSQGETSALPSASQPVAEGVVGAQAHHLSTDRTAMQLQEVHGGKAITDELMSHKHTPAYGHLTLRQSKSALVLPMPTTERTISMSSLRRCASYSGKSTDLAGTTLPVPTTTRHTDFEQSRSKRYLLREAMKLNAAMSSGSSQRTSCGRSSMRKDLRMSQSVASLEGGRVRNLIAKFSVQPM